MPMSDTTCWDRAVFDELAALLGPRAELVLSRFRDDLSRRFADTGDREGLRRDAHAVTSTAGMLGFRTLARAASTLEIACREGDDTSETLQTFLQGRAATLEVLARRAAA